jgi:ATP-dependent Clp protease ATP-binding subunit ClpA
LRPEIFARITEKLVFHRLSYEHQLEIAAKFLEKEISFLTGRGCNIRVAESVLAFVVRKGFHPKLGARPMRDAAEKLVGDAVAVALLLNGSADGCLTADSANDQLKIE